MNMVKTYDTESILIDTNVNFKNSFTKLHAKGKSFPQYSMISSLS